MSNDRDLRAVLTGDVVGSSRLAAGDLKRLLQELRGAAETFAKRFPGSSLGRLDVYGGDGWQWALRDCRLALRAAIYLRAVVRSDATAGTDTRVAVACGRIDDENLNPDRISESTGAAFTESGRCLEGMARHRRLDMIGVGNEEPGARLSAAVGLLDLLVADWTPSQAESMALALLGLKQVEIAERIGKSQSTVNQSLQTAGRQPILDFIEAVGDRF